MKEEKNNIYEGMYIISATLSEDARNKALDRIQSGITEQGGEILKVHDFGRRRMTYEVAGHREGHYFILYFKIKPSAISELWQEYHLNEDLVRFLTLRTDKVMEKIEFKTLAEAQ
jgi:small subunit ribosomal protein S6